MSAVTQNVSHSKCQPQSGSSLKKLGSSWIKTGKVEKKDTIIYEAVPHSSRGKGRLYHHQTSLSLCCPWIAPGSRHPVLQLARSGCCNWGSLESKACLCRSLHVSLLTLCGASVLPGLGLIVSAWNINSKHSPYPYTRSSRWPVLQAASLRFPLGSAVLHKQVISIWPWEISISFYALFHMCFSLLFTVLLHGLS